MEENTKNGDWREKTRKYLLNKYVITILVFAVVFIFIGEQSAVKRIRTERQIRKTEKQITSDRADIQRSQRMLQTLQDTDSLERYAREQYGMHTSKEDVYLVSE